MDDLQNVVTPDGLFGGFDMITKAIETIESNCYPQVTTLGEPNLGSRNLYPTIGAIKKTNSIFTLKNLLTYSDGKTSLLDIAEKCNVYVLDLLPLLYKLEEESLVTLNHKPVNSFLINEQEYSL